jgi:dihydroorotate dehydrogenase
MRRLTSDWYERIARPLLFRLDAETAHHLALRFLRLAPHLPGAMTFLRSYAPPSRPQTLFGLQFPNPIGLAAGFDKNGVAIPAWEALGFGFIEIGTVTAKPQPGNPLPRIFRYPREQALINRLGFNNDGADLVAERLRRLRASRWRPSIPIGVNIGKTRSTPLESAAGDYLFSFRRLQPVADYVALNVSSPNTPGLRSLQDEIALADLLRVVREENERSPAPKPILLKIAPDLPDEALPRIAAVCERFELAGIIATNTTLDHARIERGMDQEGGLSGSPLRERSTAVIRLLRGQTRLPIIGVGGIGDFGSAQEKLQAGAELLQIYTGLIYRGPRLLCDLAALA